MILCGAASAFGFDLLQAFADWTAETFGFVTPGQEEKNSPHDDPYQRLRFAVAEETSISVIPTWAPDGTKAEGEINIADRVDGIRIQGSFQTSQGEFTIRVRIYQNTPQQYTGTYQKDENIMQEYHVSGITHYLMANNDTQCVAWTNNNVEVLIQGNLSTSDLEKMVDSIYGE